MHIPFVQNGSSSIDVPLAAVLRVLRVDTVEEMVQIIEPDEERQEFVMRSIWDPCVKLSREEILETFAQHGAVNCRDKATKMQYIKHIFQSEFLPHCGVDGTQYMHEKKKTGKGRWAGG